MSDTEGMVRLMNHAANRLSAELKSIADRQTHAISWDAVERIVAAMALAEGVLRMVACSAATGTDPVDTVIAALADYQTWAGRHDDAEILDLAALDSIRRYFETMKPTGDTR